MRTWTQSFLLAAAVGIASAQPVVNPVSGPVAPGSLLSLFGTSLSNATQSASTVPLSMSVADVTSVTVGTFPAALVLVSPSQMIVQVPWEAIPGAPANVVVTNSAGASQPVPLQVAEFAPVIMNLNVGTTAQAFVLNQDGTLNGPGTILSTIPGTTPHPENSGNNVTIYATGLGPVASPPPDGTTSSNQSRPTLNTPFVLIGGGFAQVVSSVLSAKYPGVYEVVVTVPYGITLGSDTPISIQMTDSATGNTASNTNAATMATR